MLFFFVFKHKTAYDMRISDWSSDVCSSDLSADLLPERGVPLNVEKEWPHHLHHGGAHVRRFLLRGDGDSQPGLTNLEAAADRVAREPYRKATPIQIGRAACRERVGQYV